MAHYTRPQSPDDRFITAYASAHPHENWAETTAHQFQLLGIDDSAAAAGLTLAGSWSGADPYTAPDLLDRSAAQARALDHVSRCMGMVDLYPFTLSGPVCGKLACVHRNLRRARKNPVPGGTGQVGERGEDRSGIESRHATLRPVLGQRGREVIAALFDARLADQREDADGKQRAEGKDRN
jgi:hypothetical protein